MSRKAEKTKQMIIEKAAPVFNEKGLLGTSIDDVLEIAKVSKGCLYGHFTDREELSHAMAKHLLSKIVSLARNSMDKEATAKGKLLAFMSMYRNPLKTPIAGGCPIFNLAVDTDDTNPAIKQQVKAAMKGAIRDLTSVVRLGISQKEFSSKIDPEEFALKRFLLIEGALVACRALESNKPMVTTLNILRRALERYQL